MVACIETIKIRPSQLHRKWDKVGCKVFHSTVIDKLENTARDDQDLMHSSGTFEKVLLGYIRRHDHVDPDYFAFTVLMQRRSYNHPNPLINFEWTFCGPVQFFKCERDYLLVSSIYQMARTRLYAN